MTIATFCRDELLAHGPLTLDELADRAASAGVTQALNPRGTVGSAIRQRELELSDGRWVTPLWLLEGRCLTTPALGIPEWTCDPRDTSQYDLGLLELAASLVPIPLVGGGMLRRRSYLGGWKSSVALPEPRDGDLLCFRVTGGALDVTVIPTALTDTVEAARLSKELNLIVEPRIYDYRWQPGTAVNRRLAELIVADDTLLRTPVPPLSVGCDLLAKEVARIERERDAEYDEPWWDESWRDEPLQEYLRSRLITEAATPTLDEVLARVARRRGIPLTGAEAADLVRADRDGR